MKWAMRVLMVTALFALGVGGAIGHAYWRGGAEGSGQAWVGSPAKAIGVQTVAVVATASDLYPGGTADLELQISNPNAFPITLSGIEQHGAPVIAGGTACSAANAAISVPTNAALFITVPADAVSTIHVPGAAAMGLDSADACQGRVLRIPVLVTVQS